MRPARLMAGLAAVLGLLVAGCAATATVPARQPLTVERRALLPAEVAETSGLARHGGRLWTHNDSGDQPRLYALSPQSGAVESRRRLQDALNFDWEELAQDEQFLHVLDCGNNLGRRDWMQIYSVRWSALEHEDSAPVPSRLTEFRFADAGPVAGAYRHDNDCEAAAMVEGELWVFSKNWQDQHSRLYRLPVDGGRHALTSQERFPVEGLITAADYDPQRRLLALLGYTRGHFASRAFIWLVPVQQHRIDWTQARYHPLSPSGQWEALLWQPQGLLISRERSLLGASWLGEIRLP